MPGFITNNQPAPLSLSPSKIWIARLLVGIVLAWNLQAAVVFLLSPQAYVPAFELNGAIGEGIIRSFGILFLMWNVPYLVALINPYRHRLSLWEAIGMQTIGLFGESILILQIDGAHPALQATIFRFIVFDATGLVLLLLAAWFSTLKTVGWINTA